MHYCVSFITVQWYFIFWNITLRCVSAGFQGTLTRVELQKTGCGMDTWRWQVGQNCFLHSHSWIHWGDRQKSQLHFLFDKIHQQPRHGHQSLSCVCVTSLWKLCEHCSSVVPPVPLLRSLWQIRHTLSASLCKANSVSDWLCCQPLILLIQYIWKQNVPTTAWCQGLIYSLVTVKEHFAA